MNVLEDDSKGQTHVAERKKPKRTNAKSTPSKDTSVILEDNSFEDAVVVQDNATDTVKGAETPEDVGLSDVGLSDKKGTSSLDQDAPDTEAASSKDTPADPSASSETVDQDATESTDAADTETSDMPRDKTDSGDTLDVEVKSDDMTNDAVTEGDETKDAPATEDTKAEGTDADPETATLDETPKDLEPAATFAETPPTAPAIAAVPEPQKKGGFFPMVLGGVIAAGLGAGGVYYAQDNGWLNLGGNTDALTALIEGQKTQIGTLETSLQDAIARIDALAAAEPDLTPVTSAIDALQSQATQTATDLETVSTSVAAIGPRITDLMTRINEVETQPIPKAELPAEVTATYERQLADMLASVDTRFGALETTMNGRVSGIETALTEKLTALEAAQAAAMASEEDLAKAASLAAARSAMAQIDVALDNGDGFAQELATLTNETGLTAPDALSAVATDGAPTLTQLKNAFPDVARDALAAATRDAAAGGDVTPLAAFLRTQLGARSLEPREGNDADAVLSRAEAAVAAADLETALTEIAALSQSGQDVLADWVASAQTRLAALDAAAEISAQLATN